MLVSAGDVFYHCYYGEPAFAIYMSLHGFIQCYAITILLGVSDKKIWKKSFCSVFLFLGIINIIADVWSLHSLHVGFTDELVAIVMGTNLSESENFIKAFFDWKPMIVIAAFTILSFFLFFWLKGFEQKKTSIFLSKSLAFALIISIALVSIKHSRNWDGVFLNKIGLFLNYEKIEDLNKYRTNPVLTYLGKQPQIITLIIGESLTKSQCQLYGYSRETQPNLVQMADTSNFVLFRDAHSPSQYTAETFKSLLTTWSPECPNDWYKETYLFDIMKAAGYKSIWISNQNQNGVCDNLQASFSKLCDEAIWTGEHHYGWGPRDLDEVIIPCVRDVLDKETEKLFFVINLMGSHEEFSERYPHTFHHFKSDEYVEYLPEQRETMAHYDNTVLYNDFVTSEIIKQFVEKEACIFYLPDHALDLYVSDSTYAGHGRSADPISFETSTSIPLLFISTDSFDNLFPDQLEYLNSIKDSYFNSSSLPYLIMQLGNIKLEQ